MARYEAMSEQPRNTKEIDAMRWIVLVTFAAGLTTGPALAEPVKNEAWCIRTGEGVLNCEYKTKAACDYALELVAFPGWTCLRNPKR